MDDPKHTPTEPLEAVAAAMTHVRKEMGSLWAYLEAQDEAHTPLLEWPEYTRYTELHSATAALDRAVDRLHWTSHSEASTHHLLAEAREMSLSTSKATIYGMQVMSEKVCEYAEAVNGSSLPSPTEEIASNIVACQVGKLLEFSTEATRSVWLAVDMIQELHNANILKRKKSKVTGRRVEKWNLRDWITLGCLLCCILLTILQELRHPTVFTSRRGTPDCVLAQNLYVDLSHAYGLFQKSYEQSATLQQSQHDDLIDLGQKYHDLQGALENQSQRIDNIWEALGPPNINGTYYSAEGPEIQNRDCDVNINGKLRDLRALRAVLGQQVTRVQEDVAKLRENMT
jgi:hypothetical protein